MNGLLDSADLAIVTDRGADIRRRFEALGISDREWHAQTGIDRKTLIRAMENRPGVRPGTYDAIEANLGKLEARAEGKPAVRPVGDPADDLFEVEIEGNFGVRAVVKGQVRDREALREFVRDLIADMGGEEQE